MMVDRFNDLRSIGDTQVRNQLRKMYKKNEKLALKRDPRKMTNVQLAEFDQNFIDSAREFIEQFDAAKENYPPAPKPKRQRKTPAQVFYMLILIYLQQHNNYPMLLKIL